MKKWMNNIFFVGIFSLSISIFLIFPSCSNLNDILVDTSKSISENMKIINPPISKDFNIKDKNEFDASGNLILPISSSMFMEKDLMTDDLLSVNINGYEFSMPLIDDENYVESNSCAVIAKVDSSINLDENPKIILKSGSFLDYCIRLELKFPLNISIVLNEEAGYAYKHMSFYKTSNDRNFYNKLSDEQFCNFRELATPGMRPFYIFRSSSPITNVFGRENFVKEFINKYKIDNIINIENSQEDYIKIYDANKS